MSSRAHISSLTRARARARARRARLIVIVAAAAGELAGCAGIKDPYQAATSATRSAPTSATTPTDASDPAPERGGTIPGRLQSAQGRPTAGAAPSSPQEAFERYALLYVNWDAAHVVTTERELASISLGQARAQASQAAASATRDTQLTRSHVHNSGQVVAVARGRGALRGEWVIVTRELTTGEGDYAGLPPTLHVIYAQVTHSPNGWVVNQWQPQN
jgi:hypothetical protein